MWNLVVFVKYHFNFDEKQWKFQIILSTGKLKNLLYSNPQVNMVGSGCLIFVPGLPANHGIYRCNYNILFPISTCRWQIVVLQVNTIWLILRSKSQVLKIKENKNQFIFQNNYLHMIICKVSIINIYTLARCSTPLPPNLPRKNNYQ